MSSHFLITGVAGGVQPRLEINNFVRDERQFSLYVQALQRMYNSTQDSRDSFFQVGGIHGLPFVAWDGAVGSQPIDPNSQWAGYCTHGSVLFPTWHRPYVMLIEQILNGYAQQIADTYTVDKAGWKQAATNLRQPYWDWARNAVPPPEVISLQQVTITTPNGRRTAVPNPLVRYRFHPIDRSFPPPYNRWQTTLRQPTSTRSDATDNVTRLRSVLQNAQRSITTATLNMLTRVRTWPAFSSHTVGDGGSASNSIEAIHDNIHVLVGGNGQMSDPAVAAFDPIFFLHHTNVDRMLSLWSALNPGAWVTRGDAEGGTFTLLSEQAVDATTPLTPFWNQQSSFWLSSNVQGTNSLGYTYPEFAGLDMSNSTAVQAAILSRVNALYGGGGTRALTTRAFFEPTNETTAEAATAEAAAPAIAARSLEGAAPVFAARSLEGTAGDSAPAPAAVVAAGHAHSKPHAHRGHPRGHHRTPSPHNAGGGLCDWTVHVKFKKYELGGSFSVLVFLGEVPEDPNEWLVSPNMIGGHHAFVNSVAKQCANCQNQADMTEEGFVALNDGIAEHSGLGSFDASIIEPYLKRELHWRVIKTDGTPVELESLEISVLDVPLDMPEGAKIPIPGEPRRHEGVTRGRPGGYGRV